MLHWTFDSSIDEVLTISGARAGDFYIHNNQTSFDNRPVSERRDTPAEVEPELFVDSLVPGENGLFHALFCASASICR